MSDVEQLRGKVEALRIVRSVVLDHFSEDTITRHALGHEIIAACNAARARLQAGILRPIEAHKGFVDELDNTTSAFLRDDSEVAK